MSVLEGVHEDHGATFVEFNGRRVVEHYGRPERAHHAVRNGVGVIEAAYGIVSIEGDDRVGFVDNVVSNAVPREDGQGTYALLLDPQGRIETELYVYNAGSRLLLFTPPGEAASLVDDWSGKIFIEDVELSIVTDEFAVFGVHGPAATEKLASVLPRDEPPAEPLTFDRVALADAGVTLVRTDAPTGEKGYEVVCTAADAAEVFDTLLTRGSNAAPFGHRTWGTLTLEAGTPLFASELDGRIPNAAGIRNALDFEKGCYVGQEVVSRIENLGRPPERLVGLLPERVPDPGAAVFDGERALGEVTRAAESPTRDEPIALAALDEEVGELTVRVDGEEVAATIEELPFVEGSERSARLPDYR